MSPSKQYDIRSASMAVTKLDANQMKMLQQMHFANLKVCEIDNEEVKLQNDAKAAYKNTQQ